MWLESRYALCRSTDRPLVLHGGEAYGAPFLVERLQHDGCVAWLVLTPAEARDPVAIGNRLAEATNGAVGGNLLASALPYAVHLRTLQLHRSELPRLTLVVSGAGFAPEFARALGELHPKTLETWLLLDDELDGLDAHHLREAELRLTPDEARALAPRSLSENQIDTVYASTDGAYTHFLSEVNRRAGLPEVLVPASDRKLFTASATRYETAEDTLEALLRLDRQIEALEIAAEHLPERVEEVLRSAGPAYQQQGLLPRLHLLLTMLPPPFDVRERTLEWNLLAAHHAGSLRSVLPAVERHLQRHEAPELRARFAPLQPYREGLEQAARAATAHPSPLTLWQHGRMHPDPDEGVRLLTASVERSERERDAYGCARAAGALAERFTHLGDFVAAASWARLALEVFDENELKDGPRRLQLVNALAFARIMLGDVTGLAETLGDIHITLENTLPGLAATFRSTLADLEHLAGNGRLAADYTRVNLETAPRARKGHAAYQHVRSLLELGRTAEAERTAAAALALSAGMHPRQLGLARLARGMAEAFIAPAHAGATLAPLMAAAELKFEERACAALHYLLARPKGVAELPPALLERLRQAPEATLKVLSGPPAAFDRVWRELGDASRPPLELKVFGEPSARLHGAPLRLTRRQWEVVLALALHPDGMNYEELHAFLLRDDDRVTPVTLRSHVSRARRHLPISENPYRLETPFTLDLTRAQLLLAQGKVRDAVSLVQGSVLPRSDLPGVREAREGFEAALRESALDSADADALITCGGLWPDDLEVWRAALEALAPHDPRLPLIRARVQGLRKEYGLDPP